MRAASNTVVSLDSVLVSNMTVSIPAGTDNTRLVILSDTSSVPTAPHPNYHRFLRRWRGFYQKHKGHPGFTVTEDPYFRDYKASCECCPIEVHLPVLAIKSCEPGERLKLSRVLRHFAKHGQKARKREAANALIKAKALLFRYLTKEQKWRVRATKSFLVVGQDGNTYEIRWGGHGSVYRIEPDGTPSYSYCIVPSVGVPVYDSMLAVKFLLEMDIQHFFETANATDLRAHQQSLVLSRNCATTINTSSIDNITTAYTISGIPSLEVEWIEEGGPTFYRVSFLSVLTKDVVGVNNLPVYDGMAYASACTLGVDLEIRKHERGLPIHVETHTDGANPEERFLEFLDKAKIHACEDLGEAEDWLLLNGYQYHSVLLNPKTPIEPDYALTYMDERVPEGRIYYFAPPEVTGVLVRKAPVENGTQELNAYGFLLNLEAVAVVYRKTPSCSVGC